MVNESPFREAIEYFGNLQSMERAEQIAAGRKGLAEYLLQVKEVRFD